MALGQDTRSSGGRMRVCSEGHLHHHRHRQVNYIAAPNEISETLNGVFEQPSRHRR
jgi:hypothetical protein